MAKHPNAPIYFIKAANHGFAVDAHRPHRITRLAQFVRPCAAVHFARKANASGALIALARKRGLANG